MMLFAGRIFGFAEDKLDRSVALNLSSSDNPCSLQNLNLDEAVAEMLIIFMIFIGASLHNAGLGLP